MGTFRGETEVGRLLTRDGVIARREHPELATSLAHLTRRGVLTAVLPGIYADPGAAGELLTRVRALHHYDRDAVLTGRAAARMSFWPELPVKVVTAATRTSRVAPSGFAFGRRIIDPDLVVVRGGLRITSPALTALDLCADLGGDGSTPC